jgi:hypothetical protein
MRIALLAALGLTACAHRSASTDSAIMNAVDRGIWCAATYDANSRSGINCGARPSTVGVTLRGQVLVDGRAGVGPLPLANAKVLLLRQARELASAATDGQGRFSFTRNLEAGDYEVALAPGDWAGGTVVTVDRGSAEVVVFASRQ